MGWGNCGTDSAGRPIGYCHTGTCDFPGCNAEIDRGLAYACGGMHGTGTLGGDDRVDWDAMWPSCEGYFCAAHRDTALFEHEDGTEVWSPEYCVTCARKVEDEFANDPDLRSGWPTASPLIASVDRNPEGGDGTAPSRSDESAAPKADAQNPL